MSLFFFYNLNFLMCGGILASGSDGGALYPPLLPHAAALILACRIKPQVPPTAKRAKHVTWRRYPPLRALSGSYYLNITFWLKHSSTRPKLPLLMSLFFIFYFQRCGGSLVNGGHGGALDVPLLPHAAAFISACHIEPQVPPTAKRAKHVVRRRRPPLRALSGL